jgi:hypothetical protein
MYISEILRPKENDILMLMCPYCDWKFYIFVIFITFRGKNSTFMDFLAVAPTMQR